MSGTQQADEIAQMCYIITHVKSDRHPAYLARVAMKLVADNKHDDPELEIASQAESISLRIAKKGEIPTSEDISEEIGMRKLRALVLSKVNNTASCSGTNTETFGIFKNEK